MKNWAKKIEICVEKLCFYVKLFTKTQFFCCGIHVYLVIFISF